MRTRQWQGRNVNEEDKRHSKDGKRGSERKDGEREREKGGGGGGAEGRDYRSEKAGAYEAEKGKVMAKYWRKEIFL